MSRLCITVHFWGEKYPTEYVERLYRGVRRHLHEPHRFIVVTDRAVKWYNGIEDTGIRDRHLCDIKGCFARLRMWDPEWQRELGIEPNDRIVSLDLDAVITGPLDPLFIYPNQFMILTDANSSNPCRYNGSVWMLRAGYRPDVWTDFSVEEANKKTKVFEFADDQGWLEYKIPGEVGWICGPRSGVYGFQKRGWPGGSDLPKEARMVVFFGWRDPSKFEYLDWVRRHWHQRETVS